MRAQLEAAIAPLLAGYRAEAGPGWRWCEPIMTYDNARLCEVLVRAGEVIEDRQASRDSGSRSTTANAASTSAWS